MKKFMMYLTMSLISVVLPSCSGSKNENEVIEAQTLKAPISKSEINPYFLKYLLGYNNIKTKAIGAVVTPMIQWDIEETVEYVDEDKDLVMQATPAISETPVVASAYYTSHGLGATILLMEEKKENVFVLETEGREPLLEMTYNPVTGTAICTKVISKQKIYSYLCNGAMAALGWEVSVILAVPSGGSSLAFAVLWSVVSVAYCG